MSSSNNTSGNLAGTRISETQKGQGARILGSTLQNLLIRCANAFFNLKVVCPLWDGIQIKGVKYADVKIGALGATITMPPIPDTAGGTSGASVQQFKIVSDGGDYWNCKTWDGTTLGSTEIKVAKPFKLRAGTGKIASEVIRGVTYTYTYTGVYISGSSGPYKYYTRAVSGSDGSGETDYVIPDPIANDIIYAISFSTATPSSLADVTWLDINADGRAWAQ